MKILLDTNFEMIEIGDKEFKVQEMTMICLSEVLSFLPINELAQAITLSMRGDGEGVVKLSEYLKKDFATSFKAVSKATGIPEQIIGKLKPNGFVQLINLIIQVNHDSFSECFFLVTEKIKKIKESQAVTEK